MSDPWVLEAQQWLNTTYGSNPKFVKAPTTGNTGTATMDSFVMGLQIELGITDISTTFGPTTLAKVDALGTIGLGEDDVGICNIVRYALYCKGYWGGDLPDQISEDTADAIREMRLEMGISGERYLTGKIFKALLTSDAYKPTSGGSAKIRDIQRWLNGRYWNRGSFFIGPCDGHYSRDVQQALMKAIQMEIGIADADATGIFGPKTITGLKANQLGVGSTGVLVQLFSAACVFNEGFVVYDYPNTTTFRSTYDADLSYFVGAFQQFSALGNTDGRGDYDTWAQLLVSSGNPDRTANVKASDCITEITPGRGAALYAAGYRAVGRYLDEAVELPPEDRLNKQIQPGELASIFGSGLKVFPLSQYWGGEVGYFTHDRGRQDGIRANDRAQGYGFEPGTVIFFAVDYDAMDSEVTSHILPYFRGVEAGLAATGNRYKIGVYGSRNVCDRVTKGSAADWSFVSGMSWGFSGNLGYALPQSWVYNQIKEFDFTWSGGSFGLDRDVMRPGRDVSVGRVSGRTATANQFVDYLAELFQAVTDKHYKQNYPADTYDIPYVQRNDLIRQFLRYGEYDREPWRPVPGDTWIEQDWMEYALDRFGANRVTSIVDEAKGLDLSVGKLALAMRPWRPVSEGGLTLTGWFGDLCEFYGEWRGRSDDYSDGGLFCNAFLAKAGVASSFSLRDYQAGVVGALYNWYDESAADGAPGSPSPGLERQQIHNLFNSLWGYTEQGRYRAFYDYVFGGTPDGVRNVAGPELDRIPARADAVLLASRQAGENGVDYYPDELNPQERWPFIDGFARMVADKAGR